MAFNLLLWLLFTLSLCSSRNYWLLMFHDKFLAVIFISLWLSVAIILTKFLVLKNQFKIVSNLLPCLCEATHVTNGLDSRFLFYCLQHKLLSSLLIYLSILSKLKSERTISWFRYDTWCPPRMRTGSVEMNYLI